MCLMKNVRSRIVTVIVLTVCFIVTYSNLVYALAASHSHSDNCYVSGCSKHSHVSSCETVSATSVSGYSSRTCTTCNGNAGQVYGQSYCVKVLNKRTENSGSCSNCGGSTHYSGYYDLKCTLCGWIGTSYWVQACSGYDPYWSTGALVAYNHTITCSSCTNGTQYYKITCGKDTTLYYTSSGTVASTSCASVVKRLSTKK